MKATTVSTPAPAATPLGTPLANADDGGFRAAAKGHDLDLCNTTTIIPRRSPAREDSQNSARDRSAGPVANTAAFIFVQEIDRLSFLERGSDSPIEPK